jgi:hypothetical protein
MNLFLKGTTPYLPLVMGTVTRSPDVHGMGVCPCYGRPRCILRLYPPVYRGEVTSYMNTVYTYHSAGVCPPRKNVMSGGLMPLDPGFPIL